MSRIVIPKLVQSHIVIPIEGVTKLVPHRYVKPESDDPAQQFRDSLYVIAEGRYGFPAGGIKSALCEAVPKMRDAIAEAIFIKGELVEIESSEPPYSLPMREKRNDASVVVYRACFERWRMRVPVRFEPKLITRGDVLRLFALAGQKVGLGQRRPEWGQFRPGDIERLDELEKSA